MNLQPYKRGRTGVNGRQLLNIAENGIIILLSAFFNCIKFI